MTRGLLLWLLIMAIETIHGILRAKFLVPHVGEETAGLVGWVIGAAIVFVVTVFFIRWTRLSDNRSLLALGGFWALLTFIFEIGIGLLRGFDARQLLASINPVSGGLLLCSLAIMFIAPLAAARIMKVEPGGAR